jgi:hypothetical protein
MYSTNQINPQTLQPSPLEPHPEVSPHGQASRNSQGQDYSPPPALGSGAEVVGHRRTCWVRVFSILSFFPPLKRAWAYFSAVLGKVVQALARVETENPLVLIDEEHKIGRRINGDPASALLDMHDPLQRSGYSWTTSA